MSAKRKYVRYVTKEKLEKVSDENKMHIQKYFNYKNMNLSDSSKASYESDFNQWLVFINDKYSKGSLVTEDILKMLKDEDGIEDMVDLIEDYVAFCVTVLGNNERRIQRRLSSISSFFLYLLKKRRIKSNPLDYIERPSVRAGEKPQITQTYLTQAQLDEIRKYFKNADDLQLELYFELSLSTMLRVNAVANIKVDQIDLETGMITGIKEKEGYIVDGYCSDVTMELIKKWLEYRKENGIECEYLFVTKYTGEWKQVSKNTLQTVWTKKIGKIIDIPELHPHDFRHSGSSLLFNKGMSLEDVQELLNHRSPDTTLKHYIKRDMKKLQDAKKKFEL
ncbi:tyrosine-type recombinase/integrase [Paenibacillus alvei]|uniref:tyrosine-type recombinase/integrase n=2 Tax=Paenibacillus alvei TaxID=44250 RepID=UPI0002881A54|nr:tyrosine-type recombinase/integrase [Paenibacillus alvei]EJW14017.1 XerC/D family recombinase [Paenibacillus alvei DSM 29]MCY9545255.1 tyrosine-type recombinase/integrase [Paenibacillus alvei]MCY9707630.1 tyrosine-type recombinase/integrase [Paenibacillus alvei]MEC0082858.1 tyrosine-type recombinase/integrase [Paenibacillus alvei]